MRPESLLETFFCSLSTTLPFLNIIIFFLIPTLTFQSLGQKVGRSAFLWMSRLPRAHSGSYCASGLVAGGDDGDSILEIIRHDMRGLHGCFRQVYADVLLKCGINKERE